MSVPQHVRVILLRIRVFLLLFGGLSLARITVHLEYFAAYLDTLWERQFMITGDQLT